MKDLLILITILSTTMLPTFAFMTWAMERDVSPDVVDIVWRCAWGAGVVVAFIWLSVIYL